MTHICLLATFCILLVHCYCGQESELCVSAQQMKENPACSPSETEVDQPGSSAFCLDIKAIALHYLLSVYSLLGRVDPVALVGHRCQGYPVRRN